ncbi:DUF1810 domain-containing protein [soil metagenome]
MTEPDDPFDLSRFVRAQSDVYDAALAELRAGNKQTHWMWFVFPQIEGLGSSPTSRKYAIQGRAEAEAYLRHPVLGPRLVACSKAVLDVQHRTAREIFGTPDDRKLHSSATLFASISPAGSVFHQIIDRYFGGTRDRSTLARLGK